ncbi:unnamed protein product [Rhodiola kirilowii]
MDDILIYSPTWDSHLAHLTIVFDVLQKNTFLAKASKCDVAYRKVHYLGHIISEGGMDVDPAKVEAMLGWSAPTTTKQLRGFLGLTGYYRRFIQDYAKIAVPLTNMLRKDAFIWSPEAEDAFNHLKQVMSSAPTLRLPDFSQQFIVHTDASGVGMGAVLS